MSVTREQPGEHLIIMRGNDGSHVWHARVAECKGTLVQNLVSWGIRGGAFVYDAQKFPSRVALDIAVTM